MLPQLNTPERLSFSLSRRNSFSAPRLSGSFCLKCLRCFKRRAAKRSLFTGQCPRNTGGLETGSTAQPFFPPPPHDWTETPAKQPSHFSENEAPPPRMAHIHSGIFAPPPCPISPSPILLCQRPPPLPSLSLPPTVSLCQYSMPE